MLSEMQLATLFVLHQTPLERGTSGLWYPLGKIGFVPLFMHLDVQVLKLAGFAEPVPLGMIITEAGLAELRRQHLIPELP